MVLVRLRISLLSNRMMRQFSNFLAINYFYFLYIKDFTTLSSNKSHNIIYVVSLGQIYVDG